MRCGELGVKFIRGEKEGGVKGGAVPGPGTKVSLGRRWPREAERTGRIGIYGNSLGKKSRC